MTDKRKELMEEILISFAAKDKLDKIVNYLNKNDVINKQDLLDIINEEGKQYFV